ncbi:MAG: hypothetical protein QXX08_07480 [Candidatus Bathyarchaeia archaeon]
MVSWVRALKAAGVYILYVIGWMIVGLIFVVAGIFSMSGAFKVLETPPYYYFDWGSVGGGIILVFIGYLIMGLGMLATFFKISSEVIAEEVRRQSSMAMYPYPSMPPPPPLPPTAPPPKRE